MTQIIASEPKGYCEVVPVVAIQHGNSDADLYWSNDFVVGKEMERINTHSF